MTDETDIGAFFADWWGFGAFLIGLIVAYVTGRERQQYKVEQLGKDLATLKQDIGEVRRELATMHAQDTTDAVGAASAVSRMSTDIEYIRKGMDQMREDLRRKADK